MALPNVPWDTSYPGKQDTPGSEQPDLRNESRPGAGDGHNILAEHLMTIRDKAQAIALKVGDDNNLPSGSLLARVAALELATKPGWDRAWLADAVAKTGIPEDQIGFYSDDFVGGEESRWIPSEHGAVAHLDVLGGGVMKLHAAADSECRLGFYSYPVARLLVDIGHQFYAAMRFWITSDPIPSDGEAGMTLSLLSTDGGDGLPSGVIGGYAPAVFGSSTKFACATVNSGGIEAKLSTVDVDNTDFHILKMWFNDGWFFAFDDESPIEFSGTHRPSGMTGIFLGGKAGPTLDLDMVVDKLLVAFPLPQALLSS